MKIAVGQRGDVRAGLRAVGACNGAPIPIAAARIRACTGRQVPSSQPWHAHRPVTTAEKSKRARALRATITRNRPPPPARVLALKHADGRVHGKRGGVALQVGQVGTSSSVEAACYVRAVVPPAPPPGGTPCTSDNVSQTGRGRVRRTGHSCPTAKEDPNPTPGR